MSDPSDPVTESEIYEQGFADGKAESEATIRNLQAHLERIRAENEAIRQGHTPEPMTQAS